MKLDFLKSCGFESRCSPFIILFQNILFPKDFLEYISYISGYVLKLNIGLELASVELFFAM